MDFAALQHSFFLQALGSTILNSLWQGFILWLIYETVSVSYKNASAKFKNNLSTCLLFFSFVWFLTGFIFKIFNHQSIVSIASVPAGITEESAVHTASGFQVFLSYMASSLPYLSVAYIFLLLFLMAKLFAAYRYVYFISNKRLVNPPAELQDFAYKVARQIGITKKISVWISHHIDVPATIGFIKPVILIPLASINNLSGQQLEAIILHELSHIKRNDYIINLIISVIETILFFNPFVVLLSNAIKRERENCCDDFVLQYRYDPHSYASALLRLEQSRMSNLKLAMGAVSGKKELLSRIKRITSGQAVSSQFNYGQKLLALLVVTAVICSFAWLSPVEKKSASAKVLKKETNSVIFPKTKSTNKTSAINDSENLQAIILKHISQKKEPVISAETVVENFPVTQDENLDNNDFSPVKNTTEFSAPTQSKQTSFFFNQKNLKLPPFINIQNFPFQNMDFNIDLSKIDIDKLNEGLKKAYKEINALDWKKIQNEINESFSKIKVSDLPFPKGTEFYIEKAKDISKLRGQQAYNTKTFKEKLQKQLCIQDSLRRSELALVNENNARIQQLYKIVQRQYAENINGNYYFNYSDDKTSAKKKQKTECEGETNTSLDNVSGQKNIKISIRRSQGNSGLNEKKQFQVFSFDAKKPGHQNVISIEVSELP